MINQFQRNILNYAYLMYKEKSPVCEFGNLITYFKECNRDKLIKNLKELSKMNLIQIQGDLVEKQRDKFHVNYSISIKITDYGIHNIESHQKSPWIKF
ncbi:hypothetical protein MmarC5_0947 [Methanococcus maripaludis C5]|uniref:Uncharacterized protein n=1 Tax=Methanococcus maripaludis (strain C5 / ATCC BAA-1333) TaxID=402880 RepID=A4FYG9_METM5|nr:hypothetical protein [Methanococcus maripaludis]ABO35253.1 hypothetical protein MmarC5_0947 [Methanococcus maripaludis C5]